MEGIVPIAGKSMTLVYWTSGTPKMKPEIVKVDEAVPIVRK